MSTGFIKWKKTLIEGQKIFDGTKIINYTTLGIMEINYFLPIKHFVGELGFEPRLTESEPLSCQLNDSPIVPFLDAEIYLVQDSPKIKKGEIPPKF